MSLLEAKGIDISDQTLLDIDAAVWPGLVSRAKAGEGLFWYGMGLNLEVYMGLVGPIWARVFSTKVASSQGLCFRSHGR